MVLSEEEDELNPQFLQFTIDWMSIRARQAQRELETQVDLKWIDERLAGLKEDIEESQNLRD